MSRKRGNPNWKPGVSGNPEGRRTEQAQTKAKADAADTHRKRFDGWFNLTTGHGVAGMDKRQGAGFFTQNFSFEQLAELWRGDDLAARAVETLPKEALRQGYDIIIPENSDEDTEADGDEADRIREVTDKLETLGADQTIRTALGYERGLGGGAVLIGANDKQTDLTKPLDLSKVTSLDWLTPLEARELYPVYGYADPRAPKYGQPEIYRLTSRAVLPPYGGQYAETVMDIHESRLLVFPGIRVSRYQSMATQGGWGDSVLTRMWRILRDFNTAWGSAGVLVADFSRGVYKFKDLITNIATEDGYNETMARLQFMELAASTINGTVIDAQDDFKREATPIAGLADLLNQFATRLAAAAEQPLTMLFGTSPAGLNATGESDIRLFYDRAASFQKEKILPHLMTLVRILFLTTGSKREPEKWSIRFRPLWQESAKDKAAAQLTVAQADHIWINDGVYSAEEAADSHWGTGEFNPEISIDFDAREKQEMATHSPVNATDLDAMGRPVNPNYHPPVPPPEDGSGPGQTGDDTGGQDMGQDVKAKQKAAAPDPATPPTSNVQNDDAEDPEPSGDDDIDEAMLHKIIKLAQSRLGKKKPAAKPYVPPPTQGSARPAPHVTPPGPPAAPDPNTPPVPFVQSYDADWVEGLHPRAPDGKFGESEVERSKANGGSTVRPETGEHPTKGYSVAIYPDRGVIQADLTPDNYKKYVDTTADVRANDPKAHVGTWFNRDDGKWYLDIAHVTPKLADAATLGHLHNQLAIYDLKRNEEIQSHEYEAAIHGQGRFAGRVDSAGLGQPGAGSGVRPEGDDARGDRRDHEGVRAEGQGRAGAGRGRGAARQTRRADQTRILTGILRRDDIIADVDDQLHGDYDTAARQWIQSCHWTGPERVSLDRVDFSKKDSWRASKEPDRVKKFRKRILGGWEKPIILVDRPGKPRLMVADGHHRALAYLDADRPVLAYVAHVDRPEGPWDEFHDDQREKRRDESDWDEAKHPRAQDGKFGEGGDAAKSEIQRSAHDPIQYQPANDDEKQAITSWTGNGYRRINEALRKGTEPPEAKALDSAIAKSTAEKQMVVYRGINSEAVAGLKAGAVFIDRGYASTTTDHEIADGFAVNGSAFGDKRPDAGALVRIIVPAGAHAMPVYEAMGWGTTGLGANPEKEILLPRGSRFQVTRVTEHEEGANTGEAPESSSSVHGRRIEVEVKLL